MRLSRPFPAESGNPPLTWQARRETLPSGELQEMAAAGADEKKGADSLRLLQEGSGAFALPGSHGFRGEDTGFLCALEAESLPAEQSAGENLFWLR